MTVSDREVSRPVLGVVLLLAMTFPTVVAYFYFLALAGGDGKINPLQQLAYTAGKVVQFAFPILFLWISTRRRPRVGPLSARGIGLGIGFGLLVLAAIMWLYAGLLRESPLLVEMPNKVRAKLAEFGIRSLGPYLALTVFLALIHSLLEEYYWRWFVFGQLRTLIPQTPAIILSSLGFMAHHVIILYAYLPDRIWTGVLPFSLGVAVGGAFWAWLYQRSGSLLGPWISHLLVDTALFVIGWDLFQRSVR